MRWDMFNNPFVADPTFTADVFGLPISGSVATPPWPGWFWPTVDDSINFRWNPSAPSASEKVELAFGIKGFTDAVSNKYGVSGQSYRAVCTSEGQCPNGERCARRAGTPPGTSGRCIPAWWGIDHGRAAASILEPMPLKAVQRGGQTLEVPDIDALLALIYAGSHTYKLVGQRSNAESIATDLLGRPLDLIDRDIDAGAFHILVANRVGLRNESVVVDRMMNHEVWNQPVLSFQVANAVDGQLPEITESMAIRATGLDLATQIILGPTPLTIGERRSGTLVAPIDGDYIVGTLGTGDVDLYVKIGEPATDQNADRKGYGGNSFERCRLQATAGSMIHWTVVGYARSSIFQVWIAVPTGVPIRYTSNPDASRFFLVDMDVVWLTEAHPTAASRSLNDYTRTDKLRYILETDSAGTIIGGEWIGDSLRHHPDFVWWPLPLPQNTSFAGLTYTVIRALLLESIA